MRILRWVGYFVPSEPQTCKRKFPHFQPFDSPYHWFTPIFFNILDFFDFLGMMVVVYTTSLDNLISFLLSSLVGEYVARRKVEWQPCFRYMVDSHGLCYSLKLYIRVHARMQLHKLLFGDNHHTSPIARVALWIIAPPQPNLDLFFVENLWKAWCIKSWCQVSTIVEVFWLCAKRSPPWTWQYPPPPFVVVLEHIWKLKSPSKLFHFISSTYIPSIMDGWNDLQLMASSISL